MKIGIVTWYEGNYGSILQALAISELVKSTGHVPVFINYDSRGDTLSKLKSRTKIMGFRKMLRYYAASARGRCAMRSFGDKVQLRADAMKLFVSNKLAVTKSRYTKETCGECLKEADAFLCGSDQIWNPANTCYAPFYWLAFVPDGMPKIAYAPSMGMPRTSGEDREFVIAQLNSFQDISVREGATADMLNSLCGLKKHVETVVDPTLLVPKEQWVELSDTSRVSQDGEPYAFAYILRGNPEQRAFCTQVAHNRGLRLVVYPCLEAMPQGGGSRDWGDERIFDDNPADFLARIRGASLVITDSFHCTLFSILFHRDFYVLRKAFDTSSQRTRIDEILSVAGLENRVLEELIEHHIESDFDTVDARLAVHAQSSLDFFKESVARAERLLG